MNHAKKTRITKWKILANSGTRILDIGTIRQEGYCVGTKQKSSWKRGSAEEEEAWKKPDNESFDQGSVLPIRINKRQVCLLTYKMAFNILLRYRYFNISIKASNSKGKSYVTTPCLIRKMVYYIEFDYYWHIIVTITLPAVPSYELL